MKKITFFIGSLEEGGAERVVSNLTSYLVNKGHKVALVLYHDRKPFYTIHPEVEIISVRRETGGGGLIKNLRWMRRFFRENSSVVVSFLASFNILALLSTVGLKVPVLVSDRNDPRFVPGNPLIRRLRNIMYRFADGVVIQTNHNKSYFSKKVQRKSIIIYNPIDLGERAGEALRTPKEDIIVSVSRLMPQKNQKMLIRAFSKIHDDYPAFRLIIFGEGAARAELTELISTLSLQDFVLLPGSEKKIFDKICPAKLFVLSSNYEGMPNALAEAMCLGLPCISTAVSGATDMIENGINGLLTEIDAEDQLEDAMRKMLSNCEFSEQMAKKATELNTLLDKSVIAEQWREYILSFCVDGEAK